MTAPIKFPSVDAYGRLSTPERMARSQRGSKAGTRHRQIAADLITGGTDALQRFKAEAMSEPTNDQDGQAD